MLLLGNNRFAGFKGARKSTPYAAQVTAESVGRRAQEMGVQNLDVCVRGVGSGRDSSVRALNALGFRISSIRDMTPMPHNGCPVRRNDGVFKDKG